LDEFFSHFGAFVDFFSGFFPVCAASALAGLFAYVFVNDFVDFAFVCVFNVHFGFFQNSIKPFPATQKIHHPKT
jgi:hypothetical protein